MKLRRVDKTFKKNTHDYKLLKRNGNITLYEGSWTDNGKKAYLFYEVIILRIAKVTEFQERMTKYEGFTHYEKLPSNEDFGTYAWCITNYEEAKQKYNIIVLQQDRRIQKMEWQKEKNALVDPTERNYWKPTAGQHKVKFLTDGEEYEFEWEEKTIRKVGFKVEVNNEKFDWGVTRGITEQSLYGQIALIGASLGTLIGNEITLVVKGSGKTVEYTVLEALPLMKPKEEKVE